MKIYKDRVEAGQELAKLLQKYRDDPEAIVIGIPRGGVVVADQIAKELHLNLDILCPRKIGAPGNPELAIGSVTATGETFFDSHLIQRLGVSKEYIKKIVEMETKEAERRSKAYRKNRPPLDLNGKIAILVDDGLATGSSMKTAIQAAHAKKSKKIVVAVPVSPPDTLVEIREMVDEVICPLAPPFFMAVGEFYEEFYPTDDQTVIQVLSKYE